MPHSAMNPSADSLETPTSFEDVYAVDTELVRAVETAAEAGDAPALTALLSELHPADIADLLGILARLDSQEPHCSGDGRHRLALPRC